MYVLRSINVLIYMVAQRVGEFYDSLASMIHSV